MKFLSPMQKIEMPLLKEHNIKLFIKRDDLIHPIISGNKFRKLLYSIDYLKSENIKTALTFGGAYSNHIHAASYAFKINNIRSVGIIRGEELAHKALNKTLTFAKDNGMQLIFVSRSDYKKRNDPNYIEYLENKYNAFSIPEGGSNQFANEGLSDLSSEINGQLSNHVDYIACATGTGGTITGICTNLKLQQKMIGINAVKGNTDDIIAKIKQSSNFNNFDIIAGFEYGGYAKYNEELVQFINDFKNQHGIQLEQVYTGKMMAGLLSLIKQGYFKKGSTICAIHTGGLQGLIG